MARAPTRPRSRWTRWSRNSSSRTWWRWRPTSARSIHRSKARRSSGLRLADVATAQRRREILQQRARAALPAAAILVAVEEGVLLGDHELGAATGEHELDAGQRHRDLLALPVHVVGVDQPLLGHHVEVQRFEAGFGAVHELADQPVAAADAYVHFPHLLAPLVRRTAEPARLGIRDHPGA